jgi:hypothetical protein
MWFWEGHPAGNRESPAQGQEKRRLAEGDQDSRAGEDGGAVTGTRQAAEKRPLGQDKMSDDGKGGPCSRALGGIPPCGGELGQSAQHILAGFVQCFDKGEKGIVHQAC